MKKLFSVMLLILPVTVFCQSGETTMEEYNYVTKGYAMQIASGLDMKKGYKLQEIKSFTPKDMYNVARKVVVSELWKDSIRHAVALMIHIKRLDNNSETYFCVPTINASKDVWEAYYKQIRELSNNPGMLYTLVATLSLTTSEFLD